MPTTRPHRFRVPTRFRIPTRFCMPVCLRMQKITCLLWACRPNCLRCLAGCKNHLPAVGMPTKLPPMPSFRMQKITCLLWACHADPTAACQPASACQSATGCKKAPGAWVCPASVCRLRRVCQPAFGMDAVEAHVHLSRNPGRRAVSREASTLSVSLPPSLWYFRAKTSIWPGSAGGG